MLRLPCETPCERLSRVCVETARKDNGGYQVSNIVLTEMCAATTSKTRHHIVKRTTGKATTVTKLWKSHKYSIEFHMPLKWLETIEKALQSVSFRWHFYNILFIFAAVAFHWNRFMPRCVEIEQAMGMGKGTATITRWQGGSEETNVHYTHIAHLQCVHTSK